MWDFFVFLSNWNCLTDPGLYSGSGCLGHSGITDIVKLTQMGFPGRSVLSVKKGYYQEIGLLQPWQFGLSFQLNLHPSQVNLLLRLLLCTWNFYECSPKPHPFTPARLPTTQVPFQLDTIWLSFFPQASTDSGSAIATPVALQLNCLDDQKVSLLMKRDSHSLRHISPNRDRA